MKCIVLIDLGEEEPYGRNHDLYGIGARGVGVWHHRVYNKAYVGDDILAKLKTTIDTKIEVSTFFGYFFVDFLEFSGFSENPAYFEHPKQLENPEKQEN